MTHDRFFENGMEVTRSERQVADVGDRSTCLQNTDRNQIRVRLLFGTVQKNLRYILSAFYTLWQSLVCIKQNLLV